VLDEVFINRPDIYSTTVLRSLLKTKHSAVLVRPVIDRQICNKVVAKRKKVSLYDLRQCNLDKLRWWLGRLGRPLPLIGHVLLLVAVLQPCIASSCRLFVILLQSVYLCQNSYHWTT